MKRNSTLIPMVAVVVMGILVSATPAFSQLSRYVVTNDNNPSSNTATFYTIGPGGAITQTAVVNTGGFANAKTYYASAGVNVVRTPTGCVYVSNGGSIPGSVSAIVESTLTLAGTFQGSSNDDGSSHGIGLAVGSKALYAGFTKSSTIGVYKLGPNCTLTFVRDLHAVGLRGGTIDGMKVSGNILVVAYADGSVSSFNISTGLSNHDLQKSAGYIQYGVVPAGVDISKDGHWAIFGDAGTPSVVEVADISSGKISGTTAYLVGSGQNSNNVWLSPDNSLLYVSNNWSGQITAAFFDSSTGKIGASCMSPTLKGYQDTWFFTGGLVTALPTGTGDTVYVGEWAAFGVGSPSIGIVKVASNGTACRLTEIESSPVSNPQSVLDFSIGVYPPRPF